MHFQVRTDNHIPNSEEFSEKIRDEVEGALAHRFGHIIRRVEVYIQDINGHKHGVDKHCSIELSLSGHQPIVADDKGLNVEDAVSGATDKVVRAMEHMMGRLKDKGGRVSMSGEET